MAAALAGVVLVACGGGTGDAPGNPPAPPPPAPAPPPPPPPASLPFKVMPARASLAENAEGRLAAIGAGAAVSWTSSDPAVVQVDANGGIKALARGSATVTANDGTKTSSATIKVWRTEGANADPSAESLIAAALATGRISAEEALVFRVYALFGDERLPAVYDGAPDSRAAVSLRHVSGQLSTLSPAAQDILRPFLIPPIYAESWFGRQIGLPTASSGQAGRVRVAQAGTLLCSIDVVNVYLQAGLLKRRTTANYNVYAYTMTGRDDSALLDAAALEVETIDSALRGLLGRQAKSDAAEPCNGGDGAVDIYLVDMGGSTDWGQTSTYPGRCENAPAYVLIDKYKLGGIMAIDPARGRRYLRTVLAHEVMHTIQFGMDRSAACADYDWIDEATAQWASDHVFPGDNEEDGFRKLGLANANRTGTYYVDYLKGGHRESIEKANAYSTYIYFQFLARKYGAPAIKALFDAWATNGSVASLDATGIKLRDAWPEFGKALWNDVRDNVLTDLRGWDGYDYGMANVAPSNPIALANGRAIMPLLAAHGGSIRPRSLGYERLVFPDETSPVMLTNPLGTLPQARHLKLIAVKKIGGQWQAPEDWTDESTKFFCRDKQAERVQELVLIVSNSDPDPNAAPVALSAMLPFELSVSNVGCWMWQGQATLQTLGDVGNERSESTVRATDLVFEPQGDVATTAASGKLFLKTIAGNANGLFTSQSLGCNQTVTGPSRAVSVADGALIFNLDLKTFAAPPPDRKASVLVGITSIDSTQVDVCDDKTIVTPKPRTGWTWLDFPTQTNPLDVAVDGKTIEANVTISGTNARTIHNFKFTAMRE
jgi:hypothetical protein